ncbi:MAG: ribonuclease R [Candidatus Binatia bacterium]
MTEGASELERYVLRSLSRAKRKHFEIEKLAVKAPGTRDDIEDVIDHLVRDGRVVRTKKGRVALAERLGIVTGTVRIGRGGRAVVIPDEPDAPISLGHAVRPAMNGDRVLVDVDPYRRRGLYSGRIREVLERRAEVLVGTVTARGDSAPVLVPTDARSGYIATLTEDSPVSAPGRVVSARIIEYPTSYRDPIVRIEEDLGAAGTLPAEIETVCRTQGIDTEFPADVEIECSRLREPDAADFEGRADLRESLTFTIDPQDARDHDDAVSIETTAGGWRLTVSIADVSHYVPPGSAADAEAYERGNSVYFPGRCVPMLPERVSSDLASLVPDTDRLAVSVVLDVRRDGIIEGAAFDRSVIRSDHRLTYEQAQALLEGEAAGPGAEVAAALAAMADCAAAVGRARLARGAIDLDIPEPRVEVDEDGLPLRIVRRPRLTTHRIIEEFMIATNEAVARFLESKGAAFLYRIHERPDEESVMSLVARLSRLGLRLSRDGADLAPSALAALIEHGREMPIARLVNLMVLRSMKQARYSATRDIHFGLASTAYAHFTSPIRRYPDLVVHRALCAAAGAAAAHAATLPGAAALEPVAAHCSRRERRAMDAERDIDRAAAILLMEKHVGDAFAGEVTGVERYGFFVELTDIFVEGFVPVAKLDEYYDYVAERMELQSRTSHTTVRIGDRLRVRVEAAELAERRLEFAPIPTP